MKNRLTQGLTLIEVLITIGIISVLSVVIVVAINPAESGRKSRDAKRISDLSTIKKAIDLALSDKQELTDTKGPITISLASDIGGLDVTKYIPAIPKDPSYSASGSVQVASSDCKNKLTEIKSNMVYQFVSNGETYAIRSRLESMSNCNALSDDGYSSEYYEMGTKLDLF